MFTRRSFLALSAALSLTPFFHEAEARSPKGLGGASKRTMEFGPPHPFSFDLLTAKARELQSHPYIPTQLSPQHLQALDTLDYDALNKVRFKDSEMPFLRGPGLYPLDLFHMGRLFKDPMRIFLVDSAHQAREALYSPTLFSLPPTLSPHELKENMGFAGFRFLENRHGPISRRQDNWVAFLGASYFRAIGDKHQYGLSARGVAINAGYPLEEFPIFTQAYIQTPTSPTQDWVEVSLLLEGPSVVGAYRFRIRRTQAVIMDVDAQLFFRQDVEHLGIAPLTSMYWFSETLKPMAIDWRPEVHDSDGLAIWTGSGERIWRPLNNPPRVVTSTFMDNNVRGFGLMQRDRLYAHYLDNVHYERRPSLWVTPKSAWGKGAVALVELPTEEEIHDNIVAYWVPDTPIKKGSSQRFEYTLTWGATPENSVGSLAICLSTHLEFWETHWGHKPFALRPNGGCAFYVQFSGGPLVSLSTEERPNVIVSTSRGVVRKTWIQIAENEQGPPTWFGCFALDDAAGEGPVELRMVLTHKDKPLTETWLYQYWPHSP
jgi:glucans biosynthesis protein